MKVEKGVDLPSEKLNIGQPVKYKLVRSMEVGDSILCDNEHDMYKLRAAAAAYAKRADKKFISRNVIENGEKAWRLWRVK
jgi:hypothetical protein